jgi:hypothetical protein
MADLTKRPGNLQAERLTRLCQLHASMRSGEQRYVQLFFEKTHLPAERRLGNTEALGRAGEGAELRDLDKVAETFEIGDPALLV